MLLLIALRPAAAQSVDRIRAVETGLTTAVVLKGRPAPRYTIEERMKALNVPGVSVAIIRDYKIEWAKGYGFADVATRRPVTTDTLFLAGSISKPVASAGLWTTASDLARFVIEIQKSREGRSNQILKQTTIEEMLQPEKQDYGLGFSISKRDGLKWFGHDGSDAGFLAMLSATTDGRGIVVMTNSDNGGQLALEILLATAAAYGWPNKPREREAIVMPPEALERFAGEYASPIATVKVRVESDHLVLTTPGGDAALYPQSADSFFSLGMVPDAKFEADGSSLTVGSVTLKRKK